MKFTIPEEKLNLLVKTLEEREVKVDEMREIIGGGVSSMTTFINNLSLNYTLYSPRLGFYKIIKAKDYEDYEKEHATKLEQLLQG